MTEKLDLVGVYEIYQRVDASISTIAKWRERHEDFPQPDFQLAMGPIWHWHRVKAWIESRNHPQAAKLRKDFLMN